MIKHIVMWKMLPENMEANLLEAKHRLEALPAQIDVIQEFEVGIDVNGSERALDLVLYSSFESRDDLASYSAHPAHQVVVEFLRSVIEFAKVVDFEV